MFILYYVSHLFNVFYYLDISDVKENSDFLSELDFVYKKIGIPVTFTLKMWIKNFKISLKFSN